MTRSKVLGLLAIGSIALACNTIVGVEDVRLRGTGSRPDSGSSDTDPEPDPEPEPEPEPDTPVDPAATPCKENLACVRYVFLTSALFDGNLNGLAGADAKCTLAAKDKPLLAGRNFHAWLSDTTRSPKDPTRFQRGTRKYIRVDGSNFAASFSEIMNSSLANPLNIDENGNTQTGPAGSPALSVWTATTASGGSYNGINTTTSCNDWTSNAVTVAGNMGDSQSKTGAWTETVTDGDVNSGSCNSQKHLYCIEF